MLKLYNTLTRQKEEFKPINSDAVRIYTCGLTVYSEAHIGNMRAYIFMDNLRKVLKKNGYKLNHVMNITDVGHMTSDADEGEDKMEKAARLEKKAPLEIAQEITEKFLNDFIRLNIEMPEHITPATKHIKEMEEYVAKIMENGFAYETSKGIYFDTSKLKSYGELSRANLDKQLAGARVDVDDEKRNPLDFALWIKAPESHIMKWDSRWGVCYPGWHIECSAMGYKYLGKQFDIHTGGVDHIPIHHENEIAQARGAYGVNPANYWMHVEFLQIDGGKMSKSLGNCYTISTLVEKGYEPLAYRYFTYTSHYRNKLNFTWDGIDAAAKALARLRDAYNAQKDGNDVVSQELIEQYREKFLDALNDDLNFPAAMAVVWEVAKTPNRSRQCAQLLQEFDEILSLNITNSSENDKYRPDNEELASDILEILELRKIARENKEYAKSDELRDLLFNKGYKVIDTKEGQKIERV